MDAKTLARSLSTLFSELVDGPTEPCFMLNRGDPGLLRSLDALTAQAASQATAGGATIAAHVDHVRYGLHLLNRWAAGEDPWHDADWTASWKVGQVTEAEWARLRGELREQAGRWAGVLREPRELSVVDLNGVIGSIAHLGYHLGAIRQIDRHARGPRAEASA
jgi:hypothetical protein